MKDERDPELKEWRFPILEKQRELLQRKDRKGFTYLKMAQAAGKETGTWYWQVQTFKTEPKWKQILAMAAFVGCSLDCLRPVIQFCEAPKVTAIEVERYRQNIPPIRKEFKVAEKKPDPSPFRPGKKR